MSTSNKIFVVITFILIVVSVFLYIQNNKLQNTIEEKEEEINTIRQNEQALKDETVQKDSIIQHYAVRVEDLMKSTIDKENKYRLLLSKYVILLDSVKVLNQTAETDTSDNKIVVTFQGKQGKISYRGQTTYFVLENRSTYSIDINVDKTVITSKITYDIKDKIIRNTVFADSVLITDAETVMDSTVFQLIRSLEKCEQVEEGFIDRLQLIVELNQTLAREASIFGFSKFDLNVGAQYNFDKWGI